MMAIKRPFRVFICHPFREDVKANAERIKAIAREVTVRAATADRLIRAVAPQLDLPRTLNPEDPNEDALACALCLGDLATCDAVLAFRYGRDPTEGMAAEIDAAQAAGIPVVFVDSWDEYPTETAAAALFAALRLVEGAE